MGFQRESCFFKTADPHKAAITHHKLAYLHFEILKHPAYLSDLAVPFQLYCLFPNVKKHLKGRKFTSNELATLAADGWSTAQPKIVLGWVKEGRTMES
jgi:hypothetical protein